MLLLVENCKGIPANTSSIDIIEECANIDEVWLTDIYLDISASTNEDVNSFYATKEYAQFGIMLYGSSITELKLNKTTYIGNSKLFQFYSTYNL